MRGIILAAGRGSRLNGGKGDMPKCLVTVGGETLLSRKDQLLKTAYYESARNEAKIVNYLAKSVMDSAGKPAK